MQPELGCQASLRYVLRPLRESPSTFGSRLRNTTIQLGCRMVSELEVAASRHVTRQCLKASLM